ncbi:MAG TPA: hypothetical protein VF077_12540 [Nitrospiraceae bacterium]
MERGQLGLSEAEFWGLTFTEANALMEQYRIKEEREDRRAALSAYILANVHRDSQQRPDPWELTEIVAWLGHPFQRVLPPPTAAEVLDRTKVLHAVYKAGPMGTNHHGDR